jgi:hypothetical protein
VLAVVLRAVIVPETMALPEMGLAGLDLGERCRADAGTAAMATNNVKKIATADARR